MEKDFVSLETYKQILNFFIEKCEKNNIWYSLGSTTLLSAKTNINYFTSNDYLDVFMTYESYSKFKKLYNKNIIDNTNKNNYVCTNPFYFEVGHSVLIKIILLVPANSKKVEKFYSIKNKARQQIGYYTSNNSDWIKGMEKTRKIFYKFLGLWLSPLVWGEIYSSVCEDKFNGYFLIEEFNENLNKKWMPTITFETEKIEFLDLNVNIIKEWNLYFYKKYGQNWNDNIKIKRSKKSFQWIVQMINYETK